MTVFGLEKVNYVSKRSNNRVEGMSLHCVSDYVETDRMTGQRVEEVFVSPRSQAWSDIQKLKIGDEIRVFYNRHGSVDSIMIQEPGSK